jgi:hypothetical protein
MSSLLPLAQLPNKSGEINSLQNHRLQGVDGCAIPWRKGGKSEIACIHICMTFNAWLHQRHVLDPDKITTLIHSAGRKGISEPQLRGSVELPKALMDELLQALVDSRMVRVIQRDGVRWYFGW